MQASVRPSYIQGLRPVSYLITSTTSDLPNLDIKQFDYIKLYKSTAYLIFCIASIQCFNGQYPEYPGRFNAIAMLYTDSLHCMVVRLLKAFRMI